MVSKQRLAALAATAVFLLSSCSVLLPLTAAEPSATIPPTTTSLAATPTPAAAGHVIPTPTTPPTTASSSTPATLPPSVKEPDPEPRTVTIIASGDVLLHPPLWEQAQRDAADEADYDFGPLYASIAPAIEAADLAICQLETPVSDPGGPFAGWPRFTVPPQVLTTLREIGYDSCTTASNHTLDAGVDGVIRTADALEAAGLAFTGSARSADEGATPLIMSTSDGVHVGQLAYTYSFNGLERPAEQPWLANPIDIPTILADAAAAHEAGADIVALSMHWGVEYDHLPSELQRQQADELLASPDIDVIFGAHAHVVQPAEKLHDKWVFYSMGNQVARHADPIEPTREGMMPLLTFTENDNGTFAVTEVEVIPTWMQLEPDLRLINLAAAVNSTTDTDQADQYAAIIERIGGYVNAYQEKVPIRGSVGQ